MQGSRRAFLGGLAALVAAPAIVRVGSLMQLPKPEIIRAPAISMRMLDEYAIGEDNLTTRLDVLYGKMYVHPEWTFIPQEIPAELTLDDFTARIIAPFAEQIAEAIMYGSSFSQLSHDGLLRGVNPLLGAISPLE